MYRLIPYITTERFSTIQPSAVLTKPMDVIFLLNLRHFQNGEVACSREECPDLEGCHVVLFPKPVDQCCERCIGKYFTKHIRMSEGISVAQ